MSPAKASATATKSRDTTNRRHQPIEGMHNASDATTQTRVFKYGCPAVTWSKEAEDQLFMAHRLREDLVSLWHEAQDTFVALSMDSPAAQALNDSLKRAEAVRDELLERSAKERMKTGKKQASKETRELVAEAKATCKDIRSRIKEVRKENRERNKPAFEALDKQIQDDEYALRKKAHANGLFWVTADTVLADHRTARQAVIAKRMKGLSADLRHHRYDGSGTLFARLKYAADRVDKNTGRFVAGTPRRLPSLIAPKDSAESLSATSVTARPQLTTADKEHLRRVAIGSTGPGRALLPTRNPYANVLRCTVPLSDEDWDSFRATGKPRKNYGVVSVGVLPKAQMDIPVVIHRPIPRDAEITNVSVTRRKLANRFVTSVALTVNVVAPEPSKSKREVMVALGWNKRHGDAITVATVSNPATLPPRELVERGIVIEADEEGIYQVVCNISQTKKQLGANYSILDQSWIAPLLRSADIRSIRDKELEVLKAKVKAELKGSPKIAKELGVSVAEVAHWRAFWRFARLAKTWPDSSPFKQVLVDWNKQDLHLWLYGANEMDQAVACRNDSYKKIAEWLTRDCGVVCVSGFNISALKRIDKEEDTYQQEASRALLQAAAPGFLREAIVQAAKKRSTRVQMMGAGLSVEELTNAIDKKGK